MKTLFNIFLALLLLLSTTQTNATGVLHASNVLQPAQGALLHPAGMHAVATIHDQIVSTTVHETFMQSWTDSAQVVYGFPLSSRATVSSVRLWIDGKEYTVSISGAPQDTSHSSSNGGSQAKTPIQSFFNVYGYTQTAFQFPIVNHITKGSIVEVEFSVIELLNYSLGLSSYSYPLRTLMANPYLVDVEHRSEFLLELHLATDMSLEKISSTSHPSTSFQIQSNSASAKVQLGADNTMRVSTDFNLQFSVNQSDVRSTFYSNKPGTEDGHFSFLLRPSMSVDQTKLLAKTFTFVIDVSGSMMGSKIQQAKEAAAYCVANLNPQDRFNVIAFSSAVDRFQSAPVSADQTNIGSALTYIQRLSAGGGTNLQDAALDGLAQYTDSNTVNIIIFLTDGIAQLDQSLVQKNNTNHVRISVFGVGADVNSQQLSTLASLNYGIAEFIAQAANTVQVISGFYNRVRNPLWRNLSVRVSPTDVYDLLPGIMPDLNVGEQLCISGRYKKGGPATIHIHAFADGVEINNDYPVVFSNDSTTDIFCPKIWARMRIDFLLQLMAKESSQSARWIEWRNEIIRIGIRYGLVTEFTSYKDSGTVSDVEQDFITPVMVNAYPNPCTQYSTFDFKLETPDEVELSIVDLQGNTVIQLLKGMTLAGAQSLRWDTRDSSGRLVPAGTYLVLLRIGTKEQLIKLTIVR